MEPPIDLNKLEVNPDLLDRSFIESRQVEVYLLADIQDLYRGLIKNSEKDDPFPSLAATTLRDRLQVLYNTWQFFDADPGLNSGEVGEAFCRLTGMGIFEDMPELFEITDNTKIGIEIIHQPASDEDRGILNLTVSVGNDVEKKGCRFKINASLIEIKERRSQLMEQIEQKRTEIKSKQTAI